MMPGRLGVAVFVLATIAGGATIAGRVACAGETGSGAQDGAARLLAILGQPELSKAMLRGGFQEFDVASRDAAVERIARQLEPPPSGPLLSRLLLIRTPSNTAALRNAFLTNLRSPSGEARAASLRGLAGLGAGAGEFALSSLRDEDDAVLTVALDILLPAAANDAQVRPLLEALHARWGADPAHHMSMRLLEAHGIGAPPG